MVSCCHLKYVFLKYLTADIVAIIAPIEHIKIIAIPIINGLANISDKTADKRNITHAHINKNPVFSIGSLRWLFQNHLKNFNMYISYPHNFNNTRSMNLVPASTTGWARKFLMIPSPRLDIMKLAAPTTNIILTSRIKATCGKSV